MLLQKFKFWKLALFNWMQLYDRRFHYKIVHYLAFEHSQVDYHDKTPFLLIPSRPARLNKGRCGEKKAPSCLDNQLAENYSKIWYLFRVNELLQER